MESEDNQQAMQEISLKGADRSQNKLQAVAATTATDKTIYNKTTTSKDSTRENWISLDELYSPSKRLHKVDDEIPCADKINSLYSDINGLVNSLDQKVISVMKKHEKDYYNQFRGNMYSVKKEIQHLVAKTEDEKTVSRREQKLNSLEVERDWFRGEAVRLDQLCRTQKKSFEKVKLDTEQLMDDKKFLQEQLLTAKGENSSLRREMTRLETDLRTYTNCDISQLDDISLNTLTENSITQGLSSQRGERHQLPSINTPGIGSVKEIPSQSHGSSHLAQEEHETSKVEFLLPADGSAATSVLGLSASRGRSEANPSAKITREESSEYFKTIERKYQEAIKQLKHNIEAEKRNLNHLKHISKSYIMTQSQEEAIFQNCIQEVKREIAQRRKETHKSYSKYKIDPNTAKNRSASITAIEEVSAGNDSEGVKLEQFSVADKRRVTELLLSDERVLGFLYTKLFPGAKASADDLKAL
mmetsp:Transcript_39597/g.45074  ORF Transcript_39597/g.45074 Transcript_39597/m.45074 type:complete len:472 (+) Transcript_39597:44-1459(+)